VRLTRCVGIDGGARQVGPRQLALESPLTSFTQAQVVAVDDGSGFELAGGGTGRKHTFGMAYGWCGNEPVRETAMRTKADLIAALNADQRLSRALAADVGPERYARAGRMGEWSVGDLAGHLLGWRERAIGRIEGFAVGEAERARPSPAELDDDIVGRH
jgi:hypothetical protein